jgi:hypothetical protein
VRYVFPELVMDFYIKRLYALNTYFCPMLPRWMNTCSVALLSLALLCCSSLWSQKPSTPSRDSAQSELCTLGITESGSPQMQAWQFSLNRMQQYAPWYSQQYFNTSTGNIGAAFQNLVFAPVFERGLNAGFRAFLPYSFKLEDAVLYDVKAPLTHIFYVQGSQKESVLNLLHTQNIGKTLNLGFEYKRVNSEGFYTRQLSAHSALRGHVWYRSKSKRYQAMAAGVYHKGLTQENGGLNFLGDSLLRSGSESNGKLLPINTLFARNRVFQNGGLIRQTFDFARTKPDSSSKKGSFLRLQHTFLHGFQRHTYEDAQPDSANYTTIYEPLRKQTAYTVQRFVSETALLRLSADADTGSFKHLDAKVFVRQQWIVVNSIQTINAMPVLWDVLNQSAGGFISWNQQNVNIKTEAEYFFSGFSSGNYSASLHILKKWGKNRVITVDATHFKQNPDVQEMQFVSNYGSWKNNFQPITHSRLRLGIAGLPAATSIFASFQNVFNYVYFNETINPIQINRDIQVLSLAVENQIKWHKFNMQSSILAQYSADKDILRIPMLQFNENFFFEHKAPNAGTIYRIGVDVTGATAFNSRSYAAFAGVFYNGISNQANPFIQADVYVSVQVKRARFFGKAEHINNLRPDGTLILIPYHPLPGRSFKVGIAWTFFD